MVDLAEDQQVECARGSGVGSSTWRTHIEPRAPLADRVTAAILQGDGGRGPSRAPSLLVQVYPDEIPLDLATYEMELLPGIQFWAELITVTAIDGSTFMRLR